MSGKSQPKTPTIKHWLKNAAGVLETAGVNSARLDAELILSEALNVDRTWVMAHSDGEIPPKALSVADKWLVRRAKREPLAYIRGRVEFYGRQFAVNKHVLIPRPETEEIIELVKSLDLPENPILIDVGTGSGCIAISAKLEYPELEVIATDISNEALKVARQNAENLGAEVTFQKSDLIPPTIYHLPPTTITANLPYVDRRYTVTPEANTEPDIALYSGDEGYELIECLLPQAANHLRQNGYLVLESDPWQQDRIIKNAAGLGFSLVEQRPFHLILQK
jgi:release factor glutamine methyltransferase